MIKEFIPYEQALELKELGFDEPCLAFYDGKGGSKIYYNSLRDSSGDYEPFKATERLRWFGAPLYQQAFRWFREKYGMYPILDSSKGLEDVKWVYNVCSVKGGFNVGTSHGTYEEVELSCIKKLIEIAKQLIADTSQRISDEVDKVVVEEMIKIAKNK